MNKKVLFVDTWTNGKHFIQNVAREFLLNENYSCFFIHADSIFVSSGERSKIHLKSLKESDLRQYNYSFVTALNKIKPDLIITISIHGFFHRWLNYIAEKKEIPCYFFMHGIRLNSPPRIKKSLTTKIRRGVFYSKQFFYFSKDYIQLNGFQYNTFEFLTKYYIEFIFRNRTYSNNPKILLGLTYKRLFVNYSRDINYFKEFFKIEDKEKFVISGNVSATESSIRSLHYNFKRDSVIFISQPDIINESLYINLIKQLKLKIDKTEMHFIFRPHPRDRNDLLSSLSDYGVYLSREEASVDIARAKFAVGINSALLLGYASLNIPIIQISDGKNSEIVDVLGYEKFFRLNINPNIKELNDMIRYMKEFEFNITTDVERPAKIIYESIHKNFKT